MKWNKLFSIIQWAKELGSNHVANLAFACLLDSAVSDKHLKIFWEVDPSGNEFLDLLAISDGLRVSRYPIPLLKNPDAFKGIAIRRTRLDKHSFLNGKILDVEDIKTELRRLSSIILEDYPNASDLVEKYLLGKECGICAYKCTGHNLGAIYCTIHPYGYPEGKCKDWELDIYNHDFAVHYSMAKKRTFALTERGREKRQAINNPDKLGFNSEFWDNEEWSTIPNSKLSVFSIAGTKTGTTWEWFVIVAKLKCLEKGKSRWLMFRQTQKDFELEVWIIRDNNAIPKVQKTYNIKYSSLYFSTLSNFYQSQGLYGVVIPYNIYNNGINKKAIPYCRIAETAEIIEYLPKYNRLLVFNRLVGKYDLLVRV